jgi:hypothetical protein
MVAARSLPQTPDALLVDGARTPELISDTLAYRHFLSAIAVKDDADERRHGARDAVLTEMGLTGEDRETFVSELDRTRRFLDDIEAPAPSVDQGGVLPSGQPLEDRRRARDQWLDEAAMRLRNGVSAASASHLSYARPNGAARVQHL